MIQANEDVRKAIKTAGVRYWQVAQALGVNDGNFSRKLRTEFSAAEKQKLFDIIERLKLESR